MEELSTRGRYNCCVRSLFQHGCSWYEPPIITNQVFVDEFFRETQLSGISHLPTAPVRGFLNAAARLVERADTNPT